MFDTGEKKAEWEEAFSKAKEKLEASETVFYKKETIKTVLS